jgi:hypothetical protein
MAATEIYEFLSSFQVLVTEVQDLHYEFLEYPPYSSDLTSSDF